ncbi:MAG: L-seryl-tRNA(Sec) selenium transferase [Pirellulales bacterium]
MTSEKDRPYCSGNRFRGLPAVNELVDSPELSGWIQTVPRTALVSAARHVLAQCRQEIACTNQNVELPPSEIVRRVDEYLRLPNGISLEQVINGTGILIHTGLGRAPLSKSALKAIELACSGYTALEVNLGTGERGQRADIVRGLLCALTGAESATVVNNNAAALLVTLATLASGKQVIVSRGELIEIGGNFRLPEVMTASGACLHEVGTTNKTRISDYSDGINGSTAVLLKVHPSNYRISGFTQSVSMAELTELGQKHGLPVIHDVGSGALFDVSTFGLGDEPVASKSIDAGADLVLFSGDKLLGGPQAGIIVGRRRYVEQIERHPMMRALRVDKLRLAALAATLAALTDPQRAANEVPLWVMVTTSVHDLQHRAKCIADHLRQQGAGCTVDVTTTTAYLGGGSLPDQGLASVAIRIRGGPISEHELARRLRTGSPPVMGRLETGHVLIDLRAVMPSQDECLGCALAAALRE